MGTRSDAYYTPSAIADLVAGLVDPGVGASDPLIVADYAAGDGSLLEAAARRFGDIECIATDVDRRAIAALRRSRPGWRTGSCDLLSAASRRASRYLDSRWHRPHAVVLNPPFSYRGSATFPAFTVLRSGPALACLAAAIEQVRDGGGVISLLPLGSFKAQKDEAVWRAIRGCADVEQVEVFPRGAFPGVHAAVGLVAVSRIDTKAIADAVCSATDQNAEVLSGDDVRHEDVLKVRLHRGCLPMYRAVLVERGPRTMPLIHSTDLQSGEILRRRWVDSASRILTGPAVLVPRVGLPRRDKIAVVRDGERVVLTDCVIGVECVSETVANNLVACLNRGWSDIAAAYGGSCAPYVTMRDLELALEKLGFVVDR